MVVCVWEKWSEIGKQRVEPADDLFPLADHHLLQFGWLRCYSADAGAIDDLVGCIQDVCL